MSMYIIVACGRSQVWPIRTELPTVNPVDFSLLLCKSQWSFPLLFDVIYEIWPFIFRHASKGQCKLYFRTLKGETLCCKIIFTTLKNVRDLYVLKDLTLFYARNRLLHFFLICLEYSLLPQLSSTIILIFSSSNLLVVPEWENVFLFLADIYHIWDHLLSSYCTQSYKHK